MSFREQGAYYGYPSCCVDEFIERHANLVPHTEVQWAAAKRGFVPCVRHAEQILKGGRIEDIILPTRRHPTRL